MVTLEDIIVRNPGTIPAFLAVFFVVAQLAQNYLAGVYGWLAGGVAAGLLIFALSPLQHFAERVANAAMPGVRSIAEMAHPERLDLYREQAGLMWADGVIDRQERALLDSLRKRLGLSHEEAASIESEASRNSSP